MSNEGDDGRTALTRRDENDSYTEVAHGQAAYESDSESEKERDGRPVKVQVYAYMYVR